LGLDLAKYRAIFVEDAGEHLAEISRALLALEKQPASAPEIDAIFRMAHSIKGMSASLGYDSISEIAHRLEDRMQAHRGAGCVRGAEELSLLFRGVQALEAMVAAVRDAGEAPPPQPELAAALADPVPARDAPKKKHLSPTPPPLP
jgi:chemotaxis protein histidine kinase CheA